MDEAVIIVCPRCGADQEDYDGIGVMWCENCLYCAHPSRHGDGNGGWVCDLCGIVEVDDGS